MSFTTNTPQVPKIDDAFRSIPPATPSVASFSQSGVGVSPIIDPTLGQPSPVSLPGLDGLNNPIYNNLNQGVGSKEIADKISDEMTDALNSSIEAEFQRQRDKVLSKVLFYPESLGNITPKTFVDNHDAPRHALKITILDYYGSNLLSENEKSKIGDAFKAIGNPRFTEAAQDAKDVLGSALNRIGSNLGTESQLVQDQADQLDNTDIINEAIQGPPDKRDLIRYQVNERLTRNGREIITDYVTTPQNFMTRTKMVNDFAKTLAESTTATSVKLRMLPDNFNAIIYLYATGTNLNYNYNTNWTQVELQKGIVQVIEILSAATKDSMGEVVKQAAEAVGAGLFNAVVDNPTIKALIQSKLGIAPAQNYEFLFDSVKRRSFGVSVKFVPKSENEVRSVAKIISALKYYSHPERPNNTYFFRAPSVFLLENLTYVDGRGWTQNLYLPRYKVAALQSINVKYDQNGTLITHEELASNVASSGSTYKSPIKIEMELSFDELNLLTRSDIAPPERFFNANKKDGFY